VLEVCKKDKIWNKKRERHTVAMEFLDAGGSRRQTPLSVMSMEGSMTKEGGEF
jgi:hypothetical protein